MRTNSSLPRAALALLTAAPLSAQPARPPAARTAAVAPAFDTLLFNSVKFRLLGPFRGGRSTAVAGFAAQPHTFLMGSTGGGVWKTEDAGMSWRNISDGFFGGSIGAVDIADSDPNVIYVGTGSADIRGNSSAGHGVWKSLDAGATWSFIGLPESGAIRRIEVHPSNPDLVYVAALGHPFGKNPERGIYRSKDGGKTWDQVLALNDSTGASDIAMNPANPRVLYAAMWRAERKPWTMISGGPEGGIYQSTDGGDSWKKLAGGLPTGLTGKIGVTVSAANPDRVWAMIETEPDGGVYRSDDAGKTWTRTNSENKLRQRAWYYTKVVADPVDENTVYGLNVQLFRSVDGGKTFDVINVPHGDTHDLWINPTNRNLMVLGDDGGGVVSLNRGKTWSSMNLQPTAEFYDVAVDNGFPYRVYSSQQDNTSISLASWLGPHTLHPLGDWRYASACETGPVALHPDHPQVIYGGCYGGAISRWDLNTDERRSVIVYPQLQLGQAAKDLKYRFQWVSPILVSKHDRNVVYHASQFVHRTRDGGMSWETISPDLTTNDKTKQESSGGPINNDITGVEITNVIFSLSEDPDDAQTLWAGSDDGRIHITRNGGTSWQEITPPNMPTYGTVENIDLSAHRPGRAWVGVQKFRMDDFRPYIYRTEDYGRTWTLVVDGIATGSPVRSVREDPVKDGIAYAGTEHGLYVTFDGGRRWQAMQLNLPISPIADMRVHRNDLVVATQGRSIWILDDLTPLHQLADVASGARAHPYKPRDVYRVQVFGGSAAGGIEAAPDPAPAGAIIQYYLSVPDSSIRIEVLDSRGATVRTYSTDTAAARQNAAPVLSNKRGGNRLIWDLTYTGPRYPKNAVTWGYTGGVKAPPGDYRVRLTANGVTMEKPFRVLADPRLTVTQADYDEQFRIAVQVRDSINAVTHAIETIRSLKEQATRAVEQAGRIERTSEVKPAADSLASKLSGVENGLIQSRSQSGQDPIRFAGKLDNQLAELYGYVTGPSGYIAGGAEGRPTRGAMERLTDLQQTWAPLRAQLQVIIERDLVAFNALLQRLGLGSVVVPRRVVM